jgi:large subunit ribosomal protein L25
MQIEVIATKREGQGTSASRRLRRAGQVPGILYGEGKDALPIALDHNDLMLSLRKEAFQSSVLAMSIDGTKELALLRDVQVHPYKPLILHIDFQRVATDHKIHVKVPLHFMNADTCPGVKLRGGLEIGRAHV